MHFEQFLFFFLFSIVCLFLSVIGAYLLLNGQEGSTQLRRSLQHDKKIKMSQVKQYLRKDNTLASLHKELVQIGAKVKLPTTNVVSASEKKKKMKKAAMYRKIQAMTEAREKKLVVSS